MKVKNGIASSSVVRHDAEDALGQRLQERRRRKGPSSIADARRRTGRARRARRRPESRAAGSTISAREHQRRHVRDDGRRSSLASSAATSHQLERLLVLGVDRVEDRPRRHGDALDQLGDALQRQQGEAGRHQQARRPADQAAGVRRTSRRCAKRFMNTGQDSQHDEDRDRQQEDDAEDVDLELPCVRKVGVHDVDPHMLVEHQRVGGARRDAAAANRYHCISSQAFEL